MFEFISAAVSTVWMIIGGIIGFIVYLFGAYGLYRLARRRGLEFAWFAWIPFLQGYTLGELVDNNVFGLPQAKWVLLLGSAVISIISGFTWGWVVWILDALLYIYVIGANFELFKIYRPSSALVITIIGMFIPILYPIWYFVIRNDTRHAHPVGYAA